MASQERGSSEGEGRVREGQGRGEQAGGEVEGAHFACCLVAGPLMQEQAGQAMHPGQGRQTFILDLLMRTDRMY